MILRPLCASADLGDAIAYAKRAYTSAAEGARPRTITLPYQGETDLLLVRIILNLAKAADVVQILAVNPPEYFFTFLSNKWNVPTDFIGSTYPFYGPEAQPDHLVRAKHLGVTGTIIVAGADTGHSPIFVSSNAAICSAASETLTFQATIDFVTGTGATILTTSPDLVYELGEDVITITPAMPVIRFTLTLHNWGQTSFWIRQAGGNRFRPVDLFGGNFTFPEYFGGADPDEPVVLQGGACAGGHMVVKMDNNLYTEMSGGACAGGSSTRQVTNSVEMSGGACAGGGMDVYSRSDVTMSGGACAGGESVIAWARGLIMSGGACAGGASAFTTLNIPILRPTATQFGPVSILYDNRVGYIMPLAGTAVRGGSLTFRITAMGPNCTITNGSTFSATGTWYGTTSFSYVAIETKNGIVAESLPVTIQVAIQAPIPLPTADFFEVTTSYAARNSLQLVLRGHGARPGSVFIYHIGNYALGLTLTQIDWQTWGVTFPQGWQGAFWVNYWVTEHKDGIAKDSNVANINIWVNKPVLPQVDFSSYFPDTPPAEPWKTGQLGVFTYAGPVIGEDGEDLDLFWAVLDQPGPNLAYPNPDTAAQVEFTPLDAGPYSIRLSVSDSYGQTGSKVRDYLVENSIEPPTLKIPIYREIEGNIVIEFDLDSHIEKKRGGTLSFELKGNSTGCEVIIFTWPLNGQMVTMVRFTGAALTLPSSEWFTFTVTETANGVPATSALITGTVVIKAPSVPLIFNAAPGQLTWSGGKPPYKLHLVGSFSNMPSSLSALNGNWTNQTGVSFSTASFCYNESGGAGYFLLVDSSVPQKTKTISMSAAGVPKCGATAPLRLTVMGAYWVRASGGTPGYNPIITGHTEGLGYFNSSAIDFKISGSGCYCQGAGIKVTDAAGATAFVAFAPNWIPNPICVSGCPTDPDPTDSGWSLVWTCPLQDVRTNQAWMNSSTLVGGPTCTYGYPDNQPRVTLVSPDGQWRIKGDYVSSLDVNFSIYGCTIFRMNQDTGANFGPASFPFCGGLNAGANDFLVRTLEQKNA